MIEFQKNNTGMVELQKNNASLSFSETVLKGEDGGYYKPSINGNLISWQPSKTDMPQVDDFALTLRAEDVSYTVSQDIQDTFPGMVELESNTVQNGLDFAMYYAIAGTLAENIYFNVEAPGGTFSVSLQTLFDQSILPAMDKAHEHSNKSVLDNLSVSNGKLQYNGSDAGLKGDKGDTGAAGADGKSAYQYAQENGYTGTETEFSEKLAQEQLSGTTNNLTPTQVYDAVSAGIPVKVQYLHDTYGLLSFTAFNIAESFDLIVSQTIVYNHGVYVFVELSGDKSGNRWEIIFTTLAEKKDIPDIPMTLPNPHAITFTGAVTGSYDGSNTMTVNIPSAVTDEHINSLIDAKLGVIENGTY